MDLGQFQNDWLLESWISIKIKLNLDFELMVYENNCNFELDDRCVGGPFLTSVKNTPTGASTNPKNFDLNKNLNLNLTQFET